MICLLHDEPVEGCDDCAAAVSRPVEPCPKCGEYTLTSAREDFSTRYDALADSVAVSVRRR